LKMILDGLLLLQQDLYLDGLVLYGRVHERDGNLRDLAFRRGRKSQDLDLGHRRLS
jgi:hypothetical protein